MSFLVTVVIQEKMKKNYANRVIKLKRWGRTLPAAEYKKNGKPGDKLSMVEHAIHKNGIRQLKHVMLVGDEGLDSNGMIAAIVEKEKRSYKVRGLLAVGVVVLDNAKISIDLYNKAYVDMLLAAGFGVTNAYTDTDSVTYRITK